MEDKKAGRGRSEKCQSAISGGRRMRAFVSGAQTEVL